MKKTLTKSEHNQIFNELERVNAHVGRNSKHELVIWTTGYKSSEERIYEDYLRQFGIYAINSEFDKVCGKTATTFKGRGI